MLLGSILLGAVAALQEATVSRQDVLVLARQQLGSNGNGALAARRPQRASAESTFGRWLAGDTSARRACRGASSDDLQATGLIDPSAFGADPTGQTDSSDAFAAAVAELLRRNTSGRVMGGGVSVSTHATLVW